MKKLFTLAVLGLCTLSFVGCGDTKKTKVESKKTDTVTTPDGKKEVETTESKTKTITDTTDGAKTDTTPATDPTDTPADPLEKTDK
jgi:hypothetical protein